MRVETRILKTSPGIGRQRVGAFENASVSKRKPPNIHMRQNAGTASLPESE